MSQILTKPSSFSSEYQIRVPDEIWAQNLHFYIGQRNFLEIALKYCKMAILPESGHAKFLKFLDVSNTNQTTLIIIRIPN